MLYAVVLAAQVAFTCPSTSDTVAIYCESARALVTFVNRPVRRLILIDRTTKGFTTERALSDIDLRRRLHASRQSIDNWIETNQRAVTVPKDLAFAQPYVRTPDISAAQEIFRPEDGDLLMQVSGVGFDSTRQEALLYASYTCGGLCGEGFLLRLVRSPAGWKLADYVELWIS